MGKTSLLAVVAIVLATIGSLSRYGNAAGLAEPEKSVILIQSVKQDFDYLTPWKRAAMRRGVGTGFIIADNQILTNAHNVSNYRYVELRREDRAKRYPARVVFVGHDCDLALLAVDDQSFFEATAPLELAGLPEINSTVTTYGFPIGGDRISVTEGVVSRIESDTYAHSGADKHLVIQTDAAINPGNSGGPVMQGDKVVGVAFQGLREAENVGYMIPTTVIEHFLADVADGQYAGFGSMGVYLYSGLHNDAYKAHLAVPPEEDGAVVIGTMMHSSIELVLQPGDVITRADQYNVDNDGTVRMHGLRLHVSEVVEAKQIGETVDLVFYRQGRRMEAAATVALNRPVLERARQYDKPPRYVCFAGLVFVPVTRNFLETWGRDWYEEIPFYLRYLLSHSVEINTDRELKEYVVLAEIMPDEVNAYGQAFRSRIVEEINGVTIHSLEDVRDAFQQRDASFYSLKFMGEDRVLPIDVAEAHRRHGTILEKYQIPDEARLGNDT
jgi:S1-C subfamily serine protease